MGKRKVECVAEDEGGGMGPATPCRGLKRQKRQEVSTPLVAQPGQVSAHRVTRSRARRDKSAAPAETPSGVALTPSQVAGKEQDQGIGTKTPKADARDAHMGGRRVPGTNDGGASEEVLLTQSSANGRVLKDQLRKGAMQSTHGSVERQNPENMLLRTAKEEAGVSKEEPATARARERESEEEARGCPATPSKAHVACRHWPAEGATGSASRIHRAEAGGCQGDGRTDRDNDALGSATANDVAVNDVAAEDGGPQGQVGALGGSESSGFVGVQIRGTPVAGDGELPVCRDVVDEDDPGFWAAVIAQEEAREKAEKERKETGERERQERAEREKNRTAVGANDGAAYWHQVKVQPSDLQRKIWVNRGPVLTLWAAIVAQREGYTWEEAVTFGRAIAGNCANLKGRRLGLKTGNASNSSGGWEEKACEEFDVFGMKILGQRTKQGIRALQDGRALSPVKVEEYLHKAFNFNIEFCKVALERLASKYSPSDIGTVAFRLYEDFRPAIPDGVPGWGAKGVLNLAEICALTLRVGQ